jgi:metal-responsive CopG/Arc/MetJ family transcriptional regulator
MARVSLNVDETTLQQFDNMWKAEGWESRQEAIVFLIKRALAQGYISKEKFELSKAVGGGKQ